MLSPVNEGNVVPPGWIVQNVVVKLSPKNEPFVWFVCAAVAVIAFFTSHTFFVTAGTYASGGVLLALTAFLFRLRFRKRESPPTKGLTVTSNVILVALGAVTVLYLLGVVTWYE
jgi:hypothetical protein